MHRYNVNITKALLTLTIWPSDPRCSQSHSLDSGHRCRTCHSALTLNFVSLRERERKKKKQTFWLITPGPGGLRRQLTLQVQRPSLHGGTRPPVKRLTTFKEFLTLWWWALWRKLLTSEMNGELCLGGCWLAGLLTSLTNGNVCLENFWPVGLVESHRRCLWAKFMLYSGRVV